MNCAWTGWCIAALIGLSILETSSAHAQANGITAVEITVLSKQSKPLSGATAYLYQSIPPSSGASTGAFTDASGVATILAPELAETDGNVVDVLCMDKKGMRYSQRISLYPTLRTDRIYYRTVYLDTPSTLTTCLNR